MSIKEERHVRKEKIEAYNKLMEKLSNGGALCDNDIELLIGAVQTKMIKLKHEDWHLKKLSK